MACTYIHVNMYVCTQKKKYIYVLYKKNNIGYKYKRCLMFYAIIKQSN